MRYFKVFGYGISISRIIKPVAGQRGYRDLRHEHDCNAIVRVPHIRGMKEADCPGCLWTQKNRPYS